MRMRNILLFATVLAVASIATLPRLCADPNEGATAASHDSASCTDRFNALLAQAKASLVKGDRSAAINSLIAARIQLHTCEEQEERNSTAAVAVALNFTPSERTE
jgi:hypothetical protein